MTAAAAPRDVEAGAREGATWFAWSLAAATALGLAVRVAYVLIDRADITFGGDAYFYHAGANLLVQGHGFIEPFLYKLGQHAQAAEHPPLYLLYLAIPSSLGLTSSLTHLLWSCLLGSATVVVVGLLGRAVVSPRVGIIAAVLAALYPNLWIPDGSLEAETAAIFVTALTVLLAYQYARRPSWWRLALVGAACGAASLARSELILLVPLIVLPLALLTRTRDLRTQLRWLGGAVLASLVVIAPWVGYNLSRFQHPVYLSSQFDALLASANCDTTYYGSLIGYFSVPCAEQYQHQYDAHGDQSEQAIAYQQAADTYIRHHKGRVPIVVAARLGRIIEVFKPQQNLNLREFYDSIEKSVAIAALVTYYILALLSIVGAVVLRRRRRLLYPLLAPIVVVLVTVAITYANTRFRAPADVMLVVLAAVAIDAIVSWWTSRSAVAPAVAADREPATAG